MSSSHFFKTERQQTAPTFLSPHPKMPLKGEDTYKLQRLCTRTICERAENDYHLIVAAYTPLD